MILISNLDLFPVLLSMYILHPLSYIFRKAVCIGCEVWAREMRWTLQLTDFTRGCGKVRDFHQFQSLNVCHIQTPRICIVARIDNVAKVKLC